MKQILKPQIQEISEIHSPIEEIMGGGILTFVVAV